MKQVKFSPISKERNTITVEVIGSKMITTNTLNSGKFAGRVIVTETQHNSHAEAVAAAQKHYDMNFS